MTRQSLIWTISIALTAFHGQTFSQDTSKVKGGEKIWVAQPCKPTVDTLDGQKVYDGYWGNSGVMPSQEHPGIYKEIFTYIIKNLKYTTDSNHLQTKVYVTFVVDTIGKVHNACIYKTFRSSELSPLDKEVLKILETIPNFPEAIRERNGQKTPFRLFCPIQIDYK